MTDPNSWQTFDLVAGGADTPGFTGTSGYTGAVFDGRYVYLVPSSNGTGPHGVVTRFDTKGSFTTATSWSTFDMAGVDVNARGYFGGAFDGRYIYFVPGFVSGQTNPQGAIAVRYDTQGAFNAGTSWTAFNTSTLSASATGFAGGLFDGRYVYLVPYGGGTLGLVTRFDTTGSFSDTASWRTFDAAGLDGGAGPRPGGKLGGGTVGFRGAVFDGRYAYFVPMAGSIVLRFDAKEPAGLPSGQTGSFL
jgi:hypothetical protein